MLILWARLNHLSVLREGGKGGQGKEDREGHGGRGGELFSNAPSFDEQQSMLRLTTNQPVALSSSLLPQKDAEEVVVFCEVDKAIPEQRHLLHIKPQFDSERGKVVGASGSCFAKS